MARPRNKPTPTTVSVPPSGQVFVPGDEMFEEDADTSIDDVTDITNALAEIDEDDNGAFVSVYRNTLSNSGKRGREYIDRFPAIEFTLNALKEAWGAGAYLISIYGANKQLIKRRLIQIAVSPKPVAADPGVRAAPSDIEPLIETMQEGFKAMLSAIVAAQPKQQSRHELLEELKAMHSMFTPPPQPVGVTPVQQVMDAMKLGMEMAAMNSGGDGNNAWALKAMEMFGKPIIDAVMAGNLKPEQIAVPTAPSFALPDNSKQPGEEGDTAVNLMLKGYIKMLSGAAANNEPVEEYADTILNLIPSSQMAEVETMLRGSDWQEKMAAVAPVVNQYPAWFGRLRNLIIEFMDQDDADRIRVVSEKAEIMAADTVVGGVL